MTAIDNTRLKDILGLLEKPQDLPDNHKAIVYLMHHKHTLAIVSTLVTPAQARPDRFTKKPPDYKYAVRRWELLADYPAEQVQASRIRGRVQAQLIEDTVDRRDWADALAKLADPIVRDTAADVLRGWW